MQRTVALESKNFEALGKVIQEKFLQPAVFVFGRQLQEWESQIIQLPVLSEITIHQHYSYFILLSVTIIIMNVNH